MQKQRIVVIGGGFAGLWAVRRLLTDTTARQEMATRARARGRPQAAREIAGHLGDLARGGALSPVV